jgi:fibronectin type 3 domain-containing protein
MRQYASCLILLPALMLGALGQVQGIQGNVQLTGNAFIAATNHAVVLSWTASPSATSYNVYRGPVHGGPYTKIISGLPNASGVDQNVQHARNYYYVITAVNSTGESGYSNEVEAAVP